MTSFTADELYQLPELVAHLLSSAPITKTKLLELTLRWPSLSPEHMPIAGDLRIFVLTWDPLETTQPRPPAFGTTNARPTEVVVYVPLWSLAGAGRPVAETLASLGGTAVSAAAAHADAVRAGSYPHMVHLGDVPDLLAVHADIGVPEIKAVEGRWEPIGLGAITDIVQQAYGPVDLDRSLVELAPAASPRPGCPACAGERFGFIADLMESAQLMCGPHRSEAEAVRQRRFERAEASNPDGWWAIGDASIRLSEPHLPDGGYARLAAASEPAERAAVVAEAARWFPDGSRSFFTAIGDPSWLPSLTRELGAAGLTDEAVSVGEALTVVNPALAPRHAGEVAIAFALAGAADDARIRVADNVRRWPDDFWARLYAGEALEALGDPAAALEQYEHARRLGGFGERHDVAARIRRITGAPEPVARRQQRRVTRRRQ